MRELLPLLVLLAGLCAAAPESRRTPQRLAGGEIHRRTLAGLVWLHAADHGKGTGWIVDRRRRLLVTCYHVVGDNDTCEAVFPWRDKDRLVSERRLYLEHLPELRKLGLAVRGRVLKSNRATDLALVQLEQLPDGVCELPLAPEPARPGDRVFVAGNRFDLGVLWSAGAGSVRAVRTLKEGYFNSGRQLARGARVLMASVPINEADSGGPLVNEQGQVVGVSAAVAWETHGAGLFIDLSEVRALLATDAKPALPAEDQSIGRTVYRRSMVGVALVQYKGGSRFAGVLIDRGRRLLLTTAEAVAKEETVDVAFPVTQPSGIVVEAGYYRSQGDLLRRKGAISTGVVLAIDQRRNLALLEMGALPPGVAEPPLAKRPATTGDRVHLISHPQRLEVLWVYSFAVVRQMDRVNLGQTSDGPDPAVLIVQAPLSDGEGGGPVLDD
jgi:S1-C subfamily serine protease